MQNILNLTVTGTIGTSLNACVKDGCELAARLGLGAVEFDFNGLAVHCYATGEAKAFEGSKLVQKWAREGDLTRKADAINWTAAE